MTDHDALLATLDALVRETCALWDPGWVTFNWRRYTYDHVQRVRGLALTLCRREGGDPRVVELAALLHDITKPYDGEYLADAAGKRLLDEQGYWRNEVRRPLRANEVTALYDRLSLAGLLHSESGAAIAGHLLRQHAIDEAICERVARAIRHHLQPPAGAGLESRLLYDADTLDANIGLPAFVRNIYINLHFYDARRSPGSPPIAEVLGRAPLDFLRPYVVEKLPAWTEGKERDFVPRLLTAAARELATARLRRMADTWAILEEDLLDYPTTSRHGCLAVVLHYMLHQEDPSIAAETAYLADEWPRANGTSRRAQEFVAQIRREMDGIE